MRKIVQSILKMDIKWPVHNTTTTSLHNNQNMPLEIIKVEYSNFKDTHFFQ